MGELRAGFFKGTAAAKDTPEAAERVTGVTEFVSEDDTLAVTMTIKMSIRGWHNAHKVVSWIPGNWWFKDSVAQIIRLIEIIDAEGAVARSPQPRG